MNRFRRLLALLALPLPILAGGTRPSAVAEYHLGANGGFGETNLPANVLAGPDGGTNPPSVPNESASELLSLGDGGSITLRWDGGVILDGAGPDFTVFENVLVGAGNGVPFCETARVQVSQDGAVWQEFPYAFLPPVGFDPGNPFAVPLLGSDYTGLAGTEPTLVTATNGVDAGDPLVSGGNAFDLADVGLSWIRYVRVTDTGHPGSATQSLGSNGQVVYDLGETIPGAPTAGFDLDTVIAVHFGPGPAAAGASWTMYE